MRISDAKWLDLPKGLNEYWIFYRRFSAPAEMATTLEIAADKDCECWLNGKRLVFSQLSDIPPAKSVTTLEVSLKAGENYIAVQVYDLGRSNFCYTNECRLGLAAIIYDKAGNVILSTDENWKYYKNPAFIPTKTLVTSQMGMNFCYDARKEVDWKNGLNMPEGDAAVTTGYAPQYKPREIPPLLSQPSQSVAIAVCGELVRKQEYDSFAETCANDFFRSKLPTELLQAPIDHLTSSVARKIDGNGLAFNAISSAADGAFIIVDLGRESIGFLDFSITAPEGTVVDIAHGEHLDDGRVRCYIGMRCFADRYICHDGVNSFQHYLRRWGARYIELHIISKEMEKIRFNYARLIEQNIPLPEASRFECEDNALMKCRDVGIHTLRCCMHEHYEDCPWREQALYAYDSRNQALYGYYVWGNYKFAKACFNLLGDNYFKDGQIHIVSPTASRLAIEVFSLVWIADIYELYMHSGDYSVVDRNKENILKITETALARLDKTTGLYEQFNDKEIWTFFEWVPGLSGSRGLESEDDRLNACFNAYLLEVLDCVNAMYGNRFAEEAAKLRKAIAKYFRIPSNGYFKTQIGMEYLHQHTQALMIMNKVVEYDAKQSDAVFWKSYKDASLVPASFSSMPYILRGWMETSPEARKYMDALVMKQYGDMIAKGATTFWETDDGGDAFGFAGSLCHAWSSLPVFYIHSYILGVYPLEPGFRKFRVRPYPGHLTHASGTVPTPYGSISIEWALHGNAIKLNVKAPKECTPVLESFPEFPLEMR